MIPELVLICGIIACGIAVLTLLLAGRAAFTHNQSSRLTVLETQIDEKRKVLQDLGQKAAETELIQSKKDHLEKHVAALEQELKPIEEKHHKAVSEYEEVKGKLRDANQEWRQISEKVEVYKLRISQIETVEQQLKDLLDRRKKLIEEIKQFKEQKKESEQIVDTLTQKKAELESLQLKLEKLNKEVGDLRSQSTKLKESIESAETDIRQKNSQIGELDVTKAKLEKDIKHIDEEKGKLNEELGQLAERKKELESLGLLIAGKTNERDNLNMEVVNLAKALQEGRDQLKQTQEKVLRAEEDLQRRKEELNRLESTKIDLDARIETLSERMKSVGRLPPEAFASLEIPVFETIVPIRANPDEKDALEALKRLVDFCGFEIPLRLQDAFHTALKTSDISCLTVMAGVSGTGKSAFPKLYAEAMGMNFLPLAVEPRWDSPQDLFGFLNYMENRFEATTLGRALVQFNNSPHAMENSATMRDRMLLVLLDEMNLARIEYYFSEFLSKLEMRRNANILNEKDYRMVSVEVFAGHSANENAEASPPVHLYAGSNVLFVGTMNEDESTQSLSDKVIDRANVIYFGRPNKLHDKRQQILQSKDWQSIKSEHWQSWIVPPCSDTIPAYVQIDDVINGVNHALALLGRPFGWRTYKAIKAYIANHPAVKFREDSGWSPLADQIAMRVMPKLRGLDLAEHGEVFSRLGQTLHQIEDPNLHEAFSKAIESTQGFFDWRGINWNR
jgi:predicted  nucleic acid-binding Zn-ribbon protein